VSEPNLPMPNLVQVETPDDVHAVFADFASVWHTPDIFVLDFVALKAPPQPVQGPNGEPAIGVPCRVVQRVRIPPQQVFELMKALEQQLSKYEMEKAQQPGTEASPG
jgi:hypothetical protein